MVKGHMIIDNKVSNPRQIVERAAKGASKRLRSRLNSQVLNDQQRLFNNLPRYLHLNHRHESDSDQSLRHPMIIDHLGTKNLHFGFLKNKKLQIKTYIFKPLEQLQLATTESFDIIYLSICELEKEAENQDEK
jgi:hypothetical protein